MGDINDDINGSAAMYSGETNRGDSYTRVIFAERGRLMLREANGRAIPIRIDIQDGFVGVGCTKITEEAIALIADRIPQCLYVTKF